MDRRCCCCLMLILLCGCTPAPRSPEPSVAGNPGAVCASDKECVTPASFLIRNNCPFTSRCIQSKCAVVCPILIPPFHPQEKNSIAPCMKDSDCDCGTYVAKDSGQCTCIDGTCNAIIKTP